MGKLIQCAGPIARRPYCFPVTGINVYSIEEVCYYIRNNIYMMQEEVFDRDFVLWLQQELGMKETADKLESMRRDNNNLKDIVVTLCCSCDYFTEAQIQELIQIMDATREQPVWGRRKIRADSFFRSGNTERARQEYESILQSDDILQADMEECAQVYHSLGLACCQLGQFRQAAQAFCRAYEQNRRAESLQGYLYSLRLGGLEEEYRTAARELELSEDQIAFLDTQYREGMEECRSAKECRQVARLGKMAEEGRMEEYCSRSRELLRRWKKEYRQEMGL